MKRMIVFLVILIFFVPLVLSGQISNQTVGGWKITKTSGNVTKANSRIVTDTVQHGNHSQSFVGQLSDNSSITFEKKYSTPLQNVSERAAEIWVFVKKMTISGWVHVFISFGDDSGYSNPFVFLLIGADMGFFYPFNFDTPKNPKDITKIKLEFFSRGTSSFEIFLDYFFLYGTATYPRLVIDDFEDTTVPVRDESTLPNSSKTIRIRSTRKRKFVSSWKVPSL